MKEILFVSSRVPFPLVGGDKIRIFNSLKVLATQFEIDLLYIDNKPLVDETEQELKKYCNLIKTIVVSKYSHYLNTFIGLFTNKKPLQVNYYYYKKVQKWIDSNIDNYDMVFCNHIRTTEYVRKHQEIIKCVDFVDSIAMNYVKAYEKASGFWKIIYGIEKDRVKKYEKEIVKEFDKKIIISDIDKAFIDKDDKYGIKVIGNFVSEIYFDKSIREKRYQLCFLGKMDYEPNVSAVNYFVKEVFLKLREYQPEVTFKIIGANPTTRVKNLTRYEGVEVTGFVDNPYNLIQESQLFIAPMVSGAGVQNKILEAMKMEKCVITTLIGAEGLEDILKNKEIIVCGDKEKMIEKILFFLRNPDRGKEIGKMGGEYIDKKYSEKSIKIELLKYILRLD